MTSTSTFALSLLLVASASAQTVTMSDPKGDDNGPGTYEYPTDSVYKRGSFDLTEVEVKDAGANISVKVTFGAKIEDPWRSKDWKGNGFSLQMVFLFIDTDHKVGSGHTNALPGLNVSFDPASAWDKALIISPQGTARLQKEIDSKARKVKGDVIVPTSVRVRGRSIVALFPKSKVGSLNKSWGYQAMVQSNEGFPKKGDLLTRRVNEYKGKHAFGGGHDFSCDPHVVDMLAGKATGADSEKSAQHTALKAYKCDDEDPDGGTHAVIPMVYPGR